MAKAKAKASLSSSSSTWKLSEPFWVKVSERSAPYMARMVLKPLKEARRTIEEAEEEFDGCLINQVQVQWDYNKDHFEWLDECNIVGPVAGEGRGKGRGRQCRMLQAESHKQKARIAELPQSSSIMSKTKASSWKMSEPFWVKVSERGDPHMARIVLEPLKEARRTIEDDDEEEDSDGRLISQVQVQWDCNKDHFEWLDECNIVGPVEGQGRGKRGGRQLRMPKAESHKPNARNPSDAVDSATCTVIAPKPDPTPVSAPLSMHIHNLQAAAEITDIVSSSDEEDVADTVASHRPDPTSSLAPPSSFFNTEDPGVTDLCSSDDGDDRKIAARPLERPSPTSSSPKQTTIRRRTLPFLQDGNRNWSVLEAIKQQPTFYDSNSSENVIYASHPKKRKSAPPQRRSTESPEYSEEDSRPRQRRQTIRLLTAATRRRGKRK